MNLISVTNLSKGTVVLIIQRFILVNNHARLHQFKGNQIYEDLSKMMLTFILGHKQVITK